MNTRDEDDGEVSDAINKSKMRSGREGGKGTDCGCGNWGRKSLKLGVLNNVLGRLY